MKKLNVILLVICGIAIATTAFLPFWKIDLWAPQYPEGLGLKIWTDHIGGDVEVINGLNHYIGMRTLHTNDFWEFSILNYIIYALAGLAILVALFRKKALFFAYYILFMIFAVLALYDFWRWEYDYGHNLDPTAPIQVPGMAYQPPLIGYKQLLNFGAYSMPDTGGWIFISCGIILTWICITEIKKRKK
jgi:copper chaperone NosL